MEYRTDFDVWEFPWWSGAKDTIEDIKKADKMHDLQCHLEDIFSCDETPPTDTDINDYVWHDRDHVYEALGLDENGELPEEEDEDEEDTDEEEDGEE